MNLDKPKEWWMKRAAQEGNAVIGAAAPDRCGRCGISPPNAECAEGTCPLNACAPSLTEKASFPEPNQ